MHAASDVPRWPVSERRRGEKVRSIAISRDAILGGETMSAFELELRAYLSMRKQAAHALADVVGAEIESVGADGSGGHRENRPHDRPEHEHTRSQMHCPFLLEPSRLKQLPAPSGSDLP